LQIPKEPYWIFLYVGKQDVVIEGPPPSLGFLSKEDRDNKLALKVTGSLTLLFLLFSFIIGSRRSIKYNSSN
ncbi:MAG: hypothetical protein OIF32_04970, partial [Campylobacterales bacterium]|nr:hypothetical protein [Campylobacterales bacterium]